MVETAPARSQQSYRHEAFLWHDAADFTAGLVPFLEEGLRSGEPIMVAAVPEHGRWLAEALGPRAEPIEFVDMHELGRNPGRIIPAWQRFLDAHTGAGPVRGIGEPVWPGRRPEELEECQLHEGLLNLAVDPDLPFWLVCPYDVDGLDGDVIEEAYRSHPVIVEADGYQGSSRYTGRAHVDTLFAGELATAAGPVRTVHFDPHDLHRLRPYLRLELYVSGLSAARAGALAEVVAQLAGGSLQRGAGGGTVSIWTPPGAVICEVVDQASLDDPLSGRRAPAAQEHDALWVANQVCDLVQLRSTPDGTAVRVHSWV